MVVAIDGMNYIHTDVNKGYALLFEMNLLELACRIVYAGKSDLRCDDPLLVALAKLGEQNRRDKNKTDDCINANPRANELARSNLRLQDAPKKNWRSNVLGNRHMKEQLVNAVAGFSMVQAIKLLQRGRRSMPIIFYGARIGMSNTIQSINLEHESVCAKMLQCGACFVHLENSDPSV